MTMRKIENYDTPIVVSFNDNIEQAVRFDVHFV
jgi:hypothetical protein